MTTATDSGTKLPSTSNRGVGLPEDVLAPNAASALTELQAALQLHLIDRPVSLLPGVEQQPQILQAICLTFIVGPIELGELTASPLVRQICTALDCSESNDMPESRACRLWLACVAGESGAEICDELAALSQAGLWEPVQALSFRVLAYFGRRQLLADMLPKNGPLSLAQLEAWLEAAHVTEDEDVVQRLTSSSTLPLPHEVQERWATLLKAEAGLAYGCDFETVEHDLKSLAFFTFNPSPSTYAEAEARRISIRAAAALARLRAAQSREDEELMTCAAWQALPGWEREYLHALQRWRHSAEAEAHLVTALDRNPYQSPIRLALATLKASTPQAALEVLDPVEPTRELCIVRTTLLARLGQYDQAADTLAESEVEPVPRCEPARYSWARGRKQYRQQAYTLRAALAEHYGDWDTARRAWQIAQTGEQRRSLNEARQLFAARRELDTLAPAQTWRRGNVQVRFERSRNELVSIPLVGDARFFRAAALLEKLPDRAVKDFITLLRHRSWVNAEHDVGSGRLMFIGDALLKLGQVKDALRAYELANNASPLLQERLAVAHLYAQITQQALPEDILNAADQALKDVPASPWPQLLAVLGLLVAGQADAATARLDIAEARGAPDGTCRSLRAVCAALASAPTVLPELTALHLPKELTAILQLLCGEGPLENRLEPFARQFGPDWPAHCPTDPQLTARYWVAIRCNQNDWDRALSLADSLAQTGQDWAVELAVLVHVRHALARACQGELAEAERELNRLDITLTGDTVR